MDFSLPIFDELSPVHGQPLPCAQPAPSEPGRPRPVFFDPAINPVSLPPLVDTHNRTIADLRLSLTDRCNFRCTYCMDPGVQFMRKIELLTDTELVRIAAVCHALGVRRIRLTGGEPTLHPTLTELIADLAALGLDDLAMTTNGSIANEDNYRRWRDAGLDRVTFSLDTLRPDRFERMTRSGVEPARVVRSIEAARAAGLGPIKVNAVVIRGFNDDELPELGDLAHSLGVDLRLIEFMPLDAGRRWSRKQLVPADEIVERIGARHPLEPIGRDRAHSPSTGYRFADGSPGRIGVIASVTRPFCGACSRLRITPDGKVMNCLFSHDEWDLRRVLRAGAADADVVSLLRKATHAKGAGHTIADPQYQQPDRLMSAIGG